MRKPLAKQVAVFLLGFVVSFGNPVAAYTATDSIYLQPKGNLFANMQNMSPGDSVTEQIYVQNSSRENCAFYLKAQLAGVDVFGGSLQLKEKSDRLLSSLQLTLVLHSVDSQLRVSPTGTIIYSGNAAGVSSGSTPSFLDSAIGLGTIGAGRSVVLVATVQVPEQLDNAFFASKSKFYWEFSCRSVDGGGNAGGSIFDRGKDPDKRGSRDGDLSAALLKTKSLGENTPTVTILDSPTLLGQLPQTGGRKFFNELGRVHVILLILLSGLILLDQLKKRKR